MRKRYFAFPLLLLFVAGLRFLAPGEQPVAAPDYFHSEAERLAFRKGNANVLAAGEYFLTSAHCRGCHGYDSTGLANIDENGNSVNLFDHWQTSMMAQSARDPLWRAKVSHEILVNPGHAASLQDKCTSCHAPMGKYTSMFHGIAHYGLADLAVDSLGRDGVSCTGCHTIGTAAGQAFSGVIPYDTSLNIFGPFTLPFTGPMQLYEGYTPVYSAHMNESRICSACHTLFTETADTSGNLTGQTFPEQATYHEYLNSRYPADTITCQRCHMPRIDDGIVIANGFSILQPRSPFNQHTFAGANSFMLKVIRDNKVSLGSDAEDWKFDSSIAATHAMLTDSALVFNMAFDSLSADTLFLHSDLLNKAGHKLPSGYPARRMVVQLVVTDANGDTVFQSGTFDSAWRVLGESAGFEPHHDVIRQSGMPQVYEMVMGDVNGQFTSVLERAAVMLKDNRIPPQGFTTLSPVYDTVVISPDALADADFNKSGLTEGTGADRLHFHIPVTTAVGSLHVTAAVYYQSVPPKWLDEMFGYSSAEIDSFAAYYSQADKTPVKMASDSLATIILSARQVEDDGLLVFPTVTRDGRIQLRSRRHSIRSIEAWSADGKKVLSRNFPVPVNDFELILPSAKTVYLLKIDTGAFVICKKILRQ